MLRRLIPALLLAGVVLASARPARAGLVLGLDLNGSKMFGDNTSGFKLGKGGNLRLGYGLPIPVIDLTAGINLRYNKWEFDTAGVTGDVTDFSAMVGGRLGVGLLIKPFAEAYAGYGSLKGGGTTSKGTALLVGGGLDIALPIIAVGVHANYNKDVIDGSTTPTQWVAFGVDATLSF